MRDSNRGSTFVAALICIGLLLSLIMVGRGTYSYVVAIVVVSMSLLHNLFNLAMKD